MGRTGQRAALIRYYPQLQDVTLTDYKVRIIDSRSGTAARTRVLIQSSDGAAEWGTAETTLEQRHRVRLAGEVPQHPQGAGGCGYLAHTGGR